MSGQSPAKRETSMDRLPAASLPAASLPAASLPAASLHAARRTVLLVPLLALLSEAQASPLDPAQTIIRPPDGLGWKPNPNYPAQSVDMCPLAGETTAPGLYYTLVRWWPGYMSAPHTYTERPAVRCRIRHLVVQQRGGFRPGLLRAGDGGKLRAPGRRHAALRWGDPQPSGAGGDRHLRHRPGELRADRPIAAGLAAGVRVSPPVGMTPGV